MSKRYDSVIIGGGIIGLFCAYYLRKQGQSVLIVDKGPAERASSHGNCGLISPSHIVPLNKYSLILNSLGRIFTNNAPFRIKPHWNRDFIKWSVRFLRNATAKRVFRNTKAIYDIIVSSRQLYDQVLGTENLDCDWSTEGIRMVFKTRRGFEDFRTNNDFTSEFGIRAKPLVGDELLRAEPSLRKDVYGSWFFDIDAWLRPDSLVSELKNLLVKSGVDFREQTEIAQFQISKRTVRHVEAKDGSGFEADNYVLATGVWSPVFQSQLGIDLLIVPGKGYSITMKSPSLVPKTPCIMAERQVVATPWNASFRLGSTMEFAGYDQSLNPARLEALKWSSTQYLKEPYTDEVLEEWYGWRPMTPDGVPIIGKSPKQDNLYIAAGHGMLGLSMAPGTGKLISELVTGEEPYIDKDQYSRKL